MAYSLPNFNSNCSIWHGQMADGNMPLTGPIGPPDLTTVCQVYFPRYSYLGDSAYGLWTVTSDPPSRSPFVAYQLPLLLRVPKGTDLRPVYSETGADIIELELDLTYFWACRDTKPVALGFSNEYLVGSIIIGFLNDSE